MTHAKRLPVVKDRKRVMYIRDYAVEQTERRDGSSHRDQPWLSQGP